jgi:hypothetical protein
MAAAVAVGGDDVGVEGKLNGGSAGRGLGGLPRFGAGGMGGSRLPGSMLTKLMSGELCTVARAGDTEGTLADAGAGAGPRSQRRLRRWGTLGGLCSGVLTSGERSSPQVQGTPLLIQAPQRLRARIGAPQSRHIHMQNCAVSPHCPPPGLTWGHIFTLEVVFPQ